MQSTAVGEHWKVNGTGRLGKDTTTRAPSCLSSRTAHHELMNTAKLQGEHRGAGERAPGEARLGEWERKLPKAQKVETKPRFLFLTSLWPQVPGNSVVAVVAISQNPSLSVLTLFGPDTTIEEVSSGGEPRESTGEAIGKNSRKQPHQIVYQLLGSPSTCAGEKKRCYTNMNQQKARVAMLISGKEDFRTKKMTRDKDIIFW